jgi:replicative DNA helicase
MKKLYEGQGDPDELARAAHEHGPKLNNLLIIEGNSMLTVDSVLLQAKSRREEAVGRRCLIIVDYLQFWARARGEYGSNSTIRHVVSDLTTELRRLALELDSPILVISSQNRPGQGKSNLVSLKESGDLEYSADSVMFLVKPEQQEERAVMLPPATRAVDLVVEKNRYGDKGTIQLVFEASKGAFKEQQQQNESIEKAAPSGFRSSSPFGSSGKSSSRRRSKSTPTTAAASRTSCAS